LVTRKCVTSGRGRTLSDLGGVTASAARNARFRDAATNPLSSECLFLADNYRTVRVLRDVEEIDAAEVAEILNITPENVKMGLEDWLSAHGHRSRSFVVRTSILAMS
jgi:hypothetical protein